MVARLHDPIRYLARRVDRKDASTDSMATHNSLASPFLATSSAYVASMIAGGTGGEKPWKHKNKKEGMEHVSVNTSCEANRVCGCFTKHGTEHPSLGEYCDVGATEGALWQKLTLGPRRLCQNNTKQDARKGVTEGFTKFYRHVCIGGKGMY